MTAENMDLLGLSSESTIWERKGSVLLLPGSSLSPNKNRTAGRFKSSVKLVLLLLWTNV